MYIKKKIKPYCKTIARRLLRCEPKTCSFHVRLHQLRTLSDRTTFPKKLCTISKYSLKICDTIYTYDQVQFYQPVHPTAVQSSPCKYV